MEKRKTLLKLLACFLFVLFVGIACFSFVTFGSDYSDATTQAYEKELDRLEKEQKEIERKLAELSQNQDAAEEYAEYLIKQLSNLANKIEKTEEFIAQLEKDIEEKEAEIATESANIDRTYSNFLERIRISYEEPEGSFITALLDSKGLEEMLTRVENLNSLLNYDKRLREGYESAKQNLESAKAELDDSLAKQSEYKIQLDADVVQYNSLRDQNDQYIVNLKSEEAKKYQEYLATEKEREKLDKELDDYIQEMIRKSQEEYAGGKLSWPLPRDNNYITCDYGYDVLYIYGFEQVRFHYGIDVRAYMRTPLYASADGVVQLATYSSSYGYYVLIDHGSGVSTMYAHCDELIVSPGQRVTRGQQIAYSGNTGLSTGPHLHYEVRVAGNKVNPLEGDILDTPKLQFAPDA